MNHTRIAFALTFLAVTGMGLWPNGSRAETAVHERSIADLHDAVRTSAVSLHYRVGDKRLKLSGAGVLIDERRILTAAHVIDKDASMVVEFFDGTLAEARVTGAVIQGDVGLLTLVGPAPSNTKPAILADSDKVRIGDRCFLIGAPSGLKRTLTVGHVGAKRDWRVGKSLYKGPFAKPEYFQVDAAMNQGNSGGPMFDMKGHVVGISSWAKLKHEGLNFAVTSNTARRLLLDTNPIWTGFTHVLLSDKIKKALSLPANTYGYLVQRVIKDSPAERLGLRGGTKLVNLDGEKILVGGDILYGAFGNKLDSEAKALAIISKLSSLGPESMVQVVVLRNGKSVILRKKAGQLLDGMKKPGAPR